MSFQSSKKQLKYNILPLQSLKIIYSILYLDLLSLGEVVGDNVLEGIQPALGLTVGVGHHWTTLARRVVFNITFCQRKGIDNEKPLN